MLSRIDSFVRSRFGLCLVLVLTIAVAWPWLAYLGFFPHMDEGCYIYMARAYNDALKAGAPLPPVQGFSLYSFLFCGLYDLPYNHFFVFRGLDACMAMVAAWLFCLVLKKCSRKPVFVVFAGFVFLCAAFLPEVKDAGFKNPANPAWICLFSAYLLAEAKNPSGFKYFAAGALTALGILFRETFFPFAALGFVSVWLGRDFTAALRYAIGGIVMALIFLGALYAYEPQSLVNMYRGYAARSVTYATEAGRIREKFINNGVHSLSLFCGPLLLLIAAFALARANKLKYSRKKFLFWVAAAILPLYEPLVKIGFVYHFAFCLPGLGGLTGTLVEPLRRRESWRDAKGTSIFALTVLVFALARAVASLPGPAAGAQTFMALKSGEEKFWPAGQIPGSQFLIVGERLKELLPPGASLSTSGFIYPLFVETDARPPRKGPIDPVDVYEMADLSRLYQLVGEDDERLANLIAANPPDVVACAYAVSSHEATFIDSLTAILARVGYRLVEDIAPEQDPDDRWRYGWLGVKIFTKNN